MPIVHAFLLMIWNILALSFAWVLVALGQPALSMPLSVLAACLGYGLFFYAIRDLNKPFHRFGVGTIWFALVQAVQLYWFVAHPYLYIWAVYILLCLMMGAQFGVIAWLSDQERIKRGGVALALSGLWVLLEWSRLFVLSGFSWNPIGLSLAATLYPLQTASIAGVYGLSFWVMWTNLTFYKAVLYKTRVRTWILWAILTTLPYLIGFGLMTYHEQKMKEANPREHTSLLVQTAFPIEECLGCKPDELRVYVLGEWRQILRTLAPHKKERVDLVALPEYVVPFGTWSPVFSWKEVKSLFEDYWGSDAALVLPPLEEPWAHFRNGEWWVSNAFILQGIANHFSADVIAGLEDAEQKADRIEHYNAGIYFEPWRYGADKRYSKRVLVPMGEYIPFEWCRKMALSYGIGGSFTPGEKAEVIQGTSGRYGLSICYEETYGDLMRENKLMGAEVLVNLTSDVWYPNSNLPKQHLEHARLRATEMGLPLIRACNTGVTCGIDSLGREVGTLGDDEWYQGALKVKLPLYSYWTLYSATGDIYLLSFSGLLVLVLVLRRKG